MTHEIAYVNCMKLNIPKVALYSQISIIDKKDIDYNCTNKYPFPQLKEFSIIIRESDLQPINDEGERGLFYSYENKRMTANQKSTLFGVLRYEAESTNTNTGMKNNILAFNENMNWRHSITHEWGEKGEKYETDARLENYETSNYKYHKIFISEDGGLGVFCSDVKTDLEGVNKRCLFRYWTKDKSIIFEGYVFEKNIGVTNISKIFEDIYRRFKAPAAQ